MEDGYTFEEIANGIKFLGLEGISEEFIGNEAYRLRLVSDSSSYHEDLHIRREVVPQGDIFEFGRAIGLKSLSYRLPHVIENIRKAS